MYIPGGAGFPPSTVVNIYIYNIYVLPEGLWLQADSEVRIDSLSQCRMIHVILDAL